MENFKAKEFRYNPKRDLVGVVIQTIVWIIGLIIVRFLLWNMDIVSRSGLRFVTFLYLLIAAVFIIGSILSIYAHTHNRLLISETSLVHCTGWINLNTTTLHTSKIRSCSKHVGILQKVCGSMDISITTAGDGPEICFNNIENGEEAYKLINQLINNQ